MAENWQSELQLQWQGQLGDLVTEIAWSPSGDACVASSAAGEICWLAVTAVADSPHPIEPSELVLLNPTGQSIDNLSFSADGIWLAAGGQTGQLLIWNCAIDRSPPNLVQTLNLDTWIDRLVWHPHLPQLAIGYGGYIKLWDVPTASELTTWSLNKSSVFDLAWQPSGGELAVAGYKGVEIWQPTDRFGSYKLPVATASIQLAWSPDGRYLAAGNLDRSVTIVDWQNPTDPWLLEGFPGKIRQLVWLAHTEQPCLAVATGDAIALWQLAASVATATWAGQLLAGHQGVVATIAAHPTRSIFAAAATDGSACLWSAQGEIEQIITTGLSGFTALAWQPHQMCLATGNQIGEIGLWSNSA